MVTEPAATVGTEASTGPPGFDPIPSTLICRAVSFVAAQLKKNAAQSACLALAAIPYCQRSGHGSIPSPSLSGREQEEPDIAGHGRVVAAVLPVAVEGEDTLTIAETVGSVGVLDGIDVGREVALLDPLLEDAVRR